MEALQEAQHNQPRGSGDNAGHDCEHVQQMLLASISMSSRHHSHCGSGEQQQQQQYINGNMPIGPMDYECCTSCKGGGREYDAIVVGTGYGGAVAACRLAQAGLKVCILEKGQRWEAPNFPKTFWQSFIQTTFNTPFGSFGPKTGLYQVHVDGDCLALVGSGVGGGSLMSAGVMVPTPKRTRKDHRWPAQWEKDWSKYESLSQEMLEPEYVPHSFPKKKIMDAIKDELEDIEQADPKGLKINIRFKDVTNKAGVKQNACVACGNCIMGCNYNAKSSTDKNYISAAVQAGADLRTESKVLFIAENPRDMAAAGNGKRGASVCASHHPENTSYMRCKHDKEEENEAGTANSVTTPAGIRKRWRVYLNKVSFLTADIVILGAGVFGTNELLIRSRERGLRLSERLGKGVSCNGNNISFVSGSPAPLVGQGIDSSSFAATPKPQRPGPSICNSYTSSAGYTIQAGTFPHNLPYYFIRLWTFGSIIGLYSFVPSAIWDQLKVWARARFSTFMVLNMIGYDESDGEITLDKSTGRLRFVAPHDSNMVKKISACHRLAKRIRAQLYVSRFRSAAAHLLGGCGAAQDPEHGVANPDGQVFDPVPGSSCDGLHPGLFVCDGSLLPCAVGVNPSATITIVAEKVAAAAVQYAARTLVKGGDLQVASNCRCGFDGENFQLASTRQVSRHLLMSGENGRISLPQAKYSTLENFLHPAPVIVRETLRGQIAGLPCELNVEMHMGLDTEDHICSRNFGDSHRILKGRVGGTMHVPLLDKDVLHIIDGSVDMCWIDNRTPYTQYMHYGLLLASASGARYVFRGKKEMHPFLGFAFAWPESTTLLVKVQQVCPQTATYDLQTSAAPATALQAEADVQKQRHPVLEGTLRVTLFELLKSLVTLQGSGRLGFVRFLLETLARTYLLRIPRVLDQPTQSATSCKALRVMPHTDTDSYVCHVLHEFSTDDGVRVSARQWICPERSENPTSSNVVLLLNGHSTECYWLPTEPSDVVRTLLHSGYEPWLFNSRLHPLHTTDRKFNLDHIAMYDIPAVVRKIEQVRGNELPIHVVAHCVGGLNIHMAILGGHVHVSKIASLLCTNSSMFFQVTRLAMVKLMLPLMPISMAILGKNTALRTYCNSEDSLRHQLLRVIAKIVPRSESCTHDACNTFSGIFGNTFWHANVTPSVHYNYGTPNIFPMSAMPHLRNILLKGHLIDEAGQEIYMENPERLAVPTTYINGGKELLVTQKTGKSAVEFMTRHHPQFLHNHKIILDYGHSDLLTGETSSRHVFPLILEHLDRVRAGRHFSQRNLKAMRVLQEWEQENPRDNFFWKLFAIGILIVLFQVIVLNIRK
ncbi:hypothetical protein Mapa_009233 [Marchantia paleacea]|nr:hypothetical protein Mapa_009233 [Marchantia paleacea]